MSDTPDPMPTPELAGSAPVATLDPAPAAAPPESAAPPGAPADPPVPPRPPDLADPTAEPVPSGRRTVQVPMWLLVGVVVVALGVAAFFAGRATAPDAEAAGPRTLAEAVEQTASGELPVGDFDPRALLQALGRNDALDLGLLGDLLLGRD